MNRFLPDPLTPEELAALKAVAATPPFRGLPHGIVTRLVDLGFAVTVRGGLMATEDGLLRIKLSLNENLRDWETLQHAGARSKRRAKPSSDWGGGVAVDAESYSASGLNAC
jgi:hypothetical protein